MVRINKYGLISMILLISVLFSSVSFAYINPAFGARTLKYGMSGEDVRILQNFLNQNSYPIGTATGYFGPKTGEAVKKFQQANRLTPDGIVGRQTFAVIFKIMEAKNGDTVRYTVQPGDTLYLIAKKYGTTVTDIKKANGLTGDTIRIGQVLVIPRGQQPSSPSPAQPPTQTPTLKYTVKPGDTLYLIAKNNNSTVAEIKKANGLTTDNIYPGQVLVIPKATAPPATQPPATPPPATQPPGNQPPAGEQPPVQQFTEVIVSRDSAPIREGAGADLKIIIDMVKGARLPVLSTSGDWFEVRLFNGKKGWIHRDDVSGKTADNKPARNVIGFYTDDETNLIGSYNTMVGQADKLTSIAPFWFRINDQDAASLDPFGNFSQANARKVIGDAHRRNVKVLAVVHNLMYGNNATAREVMRTLLATPESRKAFIDNVVTLMQDYGFDGVNIDTEYINVADRDKLSMLIKELKTAFADQGYVLTISIPGKMSDDPNNSWSGPFDYAAIGQYADEVVVMMYLEHGYPGSPPGPISSVGFIEKILQFTVTQIPADKIVAAVPVFGSDFSLDGKDSKSLYLSYDQVMKRAKANNAMVIFDDKSKTPMFRYTDTLGQQREVWFENAESMAYKMDIINKWNLNGIALWRMGMEDPLAWDSISAKATAQK